MKRREHRSTDRRILMLLENNPYPQDTRVRQEAYTLSAAGYELTIVCPAGESQPRRENVDGIRVYRFPAPPAGTGLLGYLWEYGYSMAAMGILTLFVWLRHGFDVLHLHNPPDTMALIGLWYKLLGKKVVFDHHDLSPELYYYARFAGRGSRLVYRVLLLFEQLACRSADHVIATNHSYRKIEIERSGIAAEKITVVRNGPDLAHFKPLSPDPALRKKVGTIITYAGVIGLQDGVDHLIKALAHLADTFDRPDFRCFIIGDGDALVRMKHLAGELALGEHVCFTGWLTEASLLRYLASADICVAPEPANPYTNRSTMIKVMEYMALDKPIVAFDLPEHRVSAGDAALYARPNDERDFARQLTILMDDPERRSMMGRRGRARIEEELAWQHQAERLLAAYKALRRH